MSLLHQQVQQYLNYLEGYLAESTLASYRMKLDQFLYWAGSRDSVTSEELLQFQLSLKELGQGTQRSYISTLKNFFLWLYDTGRTESNLAVNLRIKAPQKVPRSFTPTVIDEILNTFSEEDFTGIRDRAFVSLCYSACLRRAEIIGLEMSDINLMSREVHVRKAKLDKQRIAVFSIDCADDLRKYLVARDIFLEGNPHPSLWISSSTKDTLTYYAVNGLNERIKREHGNVDLFTLHKLRHSIATQMARHTSNSNVGLIAKHLGHAELNTAYQHYVDLNVTDMHKVLEDEE